MAKGCDWRDHFGEKGAQFGGILLAGKRLDAAGHINGKGAHRQNSFGDIFGSEAASKDDAMGFGESARLGPVGGNAGAANWPGLAASSRKAAAARWRGRPMGALPFSMRRALITGIFFATSETVCGVSSPCSAQRKGAALARGR